ncbi:hypothetical protein OY671_011505, partial [Metschnikowia pulcherrima]
MHRFPDDGPFERAMQVAESDYIASSTAAQTSIAENYRMGPMRQIDILLTGTLAGGHDSFSHDDSRVVFHAWKWSSPPPSLDGRPWAFGDWVSPEMSGSESCRRSR